MEESVRINKYISESGLMSRRQADAALDRGEITINGQVAGLGDRVYKGDKVCFRGNEIKKQEEKVIYAYNKPIGLVCTSAAADKDSIFRRVHFEIPVTYVGRLDKDSQGLLLLTNDGELANQIQKARNNHEKEYVVRVNKEITEEFIQGMQDGVPILDTITKKCEVTKQGPKTFRIVLTQGLNRQIRRMCEHFDYRVVFLKRIRVLNVKLGDLPTGQYRKLTELEEKKLRSLVANQTRA